MGPEMKTRYSQPRELLQIAGEDIGLFHELIQVFLKVFPQYIKILEQALKAEDLPTTLAIMHKMKGSLQLIGASLTLAKIDAISKEIKLFSIPPSEKELRYLIGELHAIVAEVAKYKIYTSDDI